MPEIIGTTGPGHWVLLAVFGLSWIVQMFYWAGIFSRFPAHRPTPRPASPEGVSVIVCARNEARNLERFLPLILRQDHPNFEVVVVNDASADDTDEVLAALARQDSRLRFTTVPDNGKFTRGKKLALTLGLKSARNERIVLTDADCYPAGDSWLSGISAGLGPDVKLVLGYGRYEKRKGILNLLIRYETVFTALQYFAWALRGKPTMGVGRNLAYMKSLFFENKGFASHYHLASGDDDLFVNEVANRKNTRVEFHPDHHTWSLPKTSLRGWIKQKQRHLTAGRKYKRGSRWRIGLELISRITLYGSLIASCLVTAWLYPVLILFGVLALLRSVILALAARRLEEKQILLPSLVLDPFMPLILGLIWMSNLFVRNYQSWS
ncbi:MAG: glycosyltransferase [Bacteroidales bacterium]